jgi:hypothetical protein
MAAAPYLQVAVTHVVAVTVLETAQQLFEEVQSLVERQPSLLDKVVEQFSALHVLEDQESKMTKLGKGRGGWGGGVSQALTSTWRSRTPRTGATRAGDLIGAVGTEWLAMVGQGTHSMSKKGNSRYKI